MLTTYNIGPTEVYCHVHNVQERILKGIKVDLMNSRLDVERWRESRTIMGEESVIDFFYSFGVVFIHIASSTKCLLS